MPGKYQSTKIQYVKLKSIKQADYNFTSLPVTSYNIKYNTKYDGAQQTSARPVLVYAYEGTTSRDQSSKF